MDAGSLSRGTGQRKLTTYGSLSRKNSLLRNKSGAPQAPHEAKPNAQSSISRSPGGPPHEAAMQPDDAETVPIQSAIPQQNARKRKRNESTVCAVKRIPDSSGRLGDDAKSAIKASASHTDSCLSVDSHSFETAVGRNQQSGLVKKSPTNLASVASESAKTPAKTSGPSQLNATKNNDSLSLSRRPRLIDALAAQKETRPKKSSPARAPRDGIGSPRAGRTTSNQDQGLRSTDRRTATPTSRKVKYTYSQSRSLQPEPKDLDESHLMEPDMGVDATLGETHSFLSPTDDDKAEDDGSDDAGSQFAIKSVHELKRSGANNRFADEMDDLLARIGTPTTGSLTMRRNALCELAQQLPQESFAGQFRDHGSRDRIAKSIGGEQDPISAFALAASLLIFFKSGPAPHLVHQLSQHGLGQLMGRLLRVDDDIDALGAQRAMNLSRTTRASLHQVKTSLTQMPIWHGLEPKQISPRAVALILLEIVGRCADAQDLELIARQLDKDLIATVVECSSPEILPENVDFAFTVFALEALSSAGISIESQARGSSKTRLPRSTAEFLQKTLRHWPDGRGEVEAATLKLAINTTNTAKGAEAFDSCMLSLLANRVGKGVEKVKNAIGTGSLQNDLYDELLLLLGVMINIVEHNATARTSLEDEVVDELLGLWQKNRQVISEADSVDKSKVSVAISYLAVLLGYLCLAKRGRERVTAWAGDGEVIPDLIKSIGDFVTMYKTVGNRTSELEALVNELSR
ncbi:hypothetical protein HIM_10164 [Hirsutella minnesotensis 3608]|uniref:Wings apart-like protein C-terminal domain-containing protein n=1 Tax=Hirsutella minnesotensis 3608 TaxID=1043627 RepID=A0A0F7ZKD1_9HYPO|nr:hypothetical protein HIM_10164 [Hirsutella minnesotensis 3608]